MEASKRPNSSDTKKKMEMINPGRSKAQTSSKPSLSKPVSKPITSKPLRKASNSNSPSTTLSDFSFNRPISSSEKQKLELLASDPLNFTSNSASSNDSAQLTPLTASDDRSEGLKFIQATLESMLARNKEREFEEAYEEMLDSLDQSDMNERLERMKKLNDFAESLKNKRDEEGNLMIDLPENYDEILEMAVEYKKFHLDDPDVSWMQVYNEKQKHEEIDLEYKKRRDKIKQLDLVLKEKEKMLKELKTSRLSQRSQKSVSKDSDSPSKDGFFLTKVKTRTQKKQKVYSDQDFVKKNAEFIEEVKQGSMVNRLTLAEQRRLLEIEGSLNEKEENFENILVEDEIQRLEEIDKKLRNFVPQIEWEKKSVSSGQYSKSTQGNKKKKVQPGDPVLREAQERREVYNELSNINTRLTEIQNLPDKPIHEDDLKSLLIENGYDFSNQSRPAIAYRLDPVDRLIEEGKDILRNIEGIDQLDLEDIDKVVKDSDEAVRKYEEIIRANAENIVKDPEFLNLKNKWISQCENEKKVCENILNQIDKVESKVHGLADEVKRAEELEREIMAPVYVSEVHQPTLEEIDQEIEAKIQDTLSAIRPNFSDFDDITPENLPTLYYMYERVMQNPELNENEQIE